MRFCIEVWEVIAPSAECGTMFVSVRAIEDDALKMKDVLSTTSALKPGMFTRSLQAFKIITAAGAIRRAPAAIIRPMPHLKNVSFRNVIELFTPI